MLSPVQNRRVLTHLVERLSDLNNDEVTLQGLACFNYALSLHETKSLRYRMMSKAPAARRNLQVNKLLPKGALEIVKAHAATLRKQNLCLKYGAKALAL
jgi:hypothetical protein